MSDAVQGQENCVLSPRRIELYKSAATVNALITIRSPNQDESLNANESETFTLEEYRKIILDFRMQNKDLILARVNTPDPYRQDLVYSYYYIASEVNKVLFKYESSRRLLHRMKVRNPLNNMYIIGQVQYYRIKKEEVDRAIVDCFFRDIRLRYAEGDLPNQTFHPSTGMGLDPNNLGEKNEISAFSEVFRTMKSDESLVSDQSVQTEPKKPQINHPLDKLLREKMKKKKKAKKETKIYMKDDDKEESDTEKDPLPQEVLRMFDEGEIEFPVIPEQYVNKTEGLDESSVNDPQKALNILNNSSSTNLKKDTKQTEMNLFQEQKQVSFPVMLNYTADFFATDDDFLLRNDIRDYFKKNSVDPSENFLFELDRTENDLFAILETPSSSENEEALSWKRMLTFHISLLLVLVSVVVLLGLNPIAIIITLPLALFVFISFLCSIVYVLCVRRSSFDSLAVRSVDNIQI